MKRGHVAPCWTVHDYCRKAPNICASSSFCLRIASGAPTRVRAIGVRPKSDANWRTKVQCLRAADAAGFSLGRSRAGWMSLARCVRVRAGDPSKRCASSRDPRREWRARQHPRIDDAQPPRASRTCSGPQEFRAACGWTSGTCSTAATTWSPTRSIICPARPRTRAGSWPAWISGSHR